MSHSCSHPQVDTSRCTRCGLCVEACRYEAVEMRENRPVFHCAQRDGADCFQDPDEAFLCEDICPQQAIGWEFGIILEDNSAKCQPQAVK